MNEFKPTVATSNRYLHITEEEAKDLMKKGYIHFPEFGYEMSILINEILTQEGVYQYCEEKISSLTANNTLLTPVGKVLKTRLDVVQSYGIQATEDILLQLFKYAKVEHDKQP